jgi:ADP-L-glycero-D-manno-heptose 6-epimerase
MLDKNQNIFIFGGAGFLGSSLISYLNSLGYSNITIFENDNIHKKWKNLVGLKFNQILDKEKVEDFHYKEDSVFLLLGARSSTFAKEDSDTYYHNVVYPKKVINLLPNNKIIFASTAAIYGNSGNFKESNLTGSPTNFYSFTKSLVDQYIDSLKRDNVYSLRLNNMYGSREFFKSEDSQSPIYKWLTSNNFPSIYLNPEFKRDFIYVNDVCKVIFHILNLEQEKGGIYNVGSGVANAWQEVLRGVSECRGGNDWFKLEREEPEFIKKPSYQRFTQADITLLREKLCYKELMTSLEDGIKNVWEKLNKI